MLTVQNLQKKFNNHFAVDNVDFSVSSGEIFSLIGPNSSGKTTIVKSITGLLRIDGGQVTVGGNDVAKNPKEAKSLIGYIPDEPAVWSGMTGEEFLHFVGALYGMDPELRRKKIKELLPLYALDGVEKDQFEQYSRGIKQKFSILAALMHEPKLIVVDEPIVGLDPESAIVTKKIFHDFARAGGAILLVTHTLSIAHEISTRIGVLKKGKLIAVGTFEELKQIGKVGHNATLEDVYTALTRIM